MNPHLKAQAPRGRPRGSKSRPKVNTPNIDKAGWRISEWGADVGVSRGSVYNLMRAGEVDFVKVGFATVILTPPREYLMRLSRQQSTAAD